jgi:CRISPR type IV-associated protein Csf2
MRLITMEGTVTALSSISHNGGETFGTTAKLRREKFMQPSGEVEEVPVVSGNSMRGALRDLGMLHMCSALGYGVDHETGDVQGLPLSAFYFLFSGGTLTSTGGERIDIDYARRLRALIPLVGVWGGAVGNMILPGKARFGKLIPIVRETVHLIPERFHPANPVSVWECVQEEMYTRKDDEKNEALRRMIGAGARTLLDDPGTRKTALAEGRGEGAVQMMYHIETIAAGMQFHWRVDLDDVTDIEFEAFLTCLAEFSRRPYIGGKSGTGLGHVAVSMEDWIEIDSRLQALDGRTIARPIGAEYAGHLKTQRIAIRELLEAMQ